jgi:hypothetical protein
MSTWKIVLGFRRFGFEASTIPFAPQDPTILADVMLVGIGQENTEREAIHRSTSLHNHPTHGIVRKG